MAKIRLINSMRDAILDWMLARHKAKDTRLVDIQDKVVDTVNAAILKRYPADDMAILKKYGATRIDICLKFSDSGRIFGIEFYHNKAAQARLVPVPYAGGCSNSTVYPVSREEAEIIESYAQVERKVNEDFCKKKSEYTSFLYACTTLEGVMEVVNLPREILDRFKVNTQLAAINPDIIEGIKQEFGGEDAS